MSWSFWVDRKTRVVVRHRRAVPLTIVEFTILDALHRRRGTERRPHKAMLVRELVDEVYRGVSDPPANPHASVNVIVGRINAKLRHVMIRVRGRRRQRNSTYQLEDYG
jgi:hypothetical protein